METGKSMFEEMLGPKKATDYLDEIAMLKVTIQELEDEVSRLKIKVADVKEGKYIPLVATDETIEELLEYVYGAAEVMGLYMVKILGLNRKSYFYSRYLGRALQCINAIRDIAEDHEFGRSYLPISDLEQYGLESLDYNYTRRHPKLFSEFIKAQISRYCRWQEIAEKGYQYVPKRYLIAIKTVSDMYNWTAEQILKNPFIVYDEKVKPLIINILTTVIENIIDPGPQKTTLFPCFVQSQPRLQSLKI